MAKLSRPYFWRLVDLAKAVSLAAALGAKHVWMVPEDAKTIVAREQMGVITVDAERISVRDETGQVKSLAKDHLNGVAIETNDSGPWGADLWWMLFDEKGQMACAFPQGATGEQAVIDYVVALPSFDHRKMIEAMGSTNNAIFPVWRGAPDTAENLQQAP